MIAAESFWQINLGQVVLLLATVGGFILWFSRFEGKIRSTAEALKRMAEETTKASTALWNRIERIDREGSRKSQQELVSGEKLNAVMMARIDAHDKLIVDLLPRVAEMGVNLEWIARHIRKNGTGG